MSAAAISDCCSGCLSVQSRGAPSVPTFYQNPREFHSFPAVCFSVPLRRAFSRKIMPTAPITSRTTLHVRKISSVNDFRTNSLESNGNYDTSPVKDPARLAHETLVESAELFVKDVMKDWDSSHDWWHAERVRKVAMSLAMEEGLSQESRELVEIAALLHDVGDHKYTKLGYAGPEAIEAFLSAQHYPEEKTRTIMTIITRMGFKEELGGEMAQGIFPELAVVQDADRLDAIGAIGVARCLTYGGSRNRILHDPEAHYREALSKEEYQKDSAKPTTIHHFYEKLLKLKDLMKTEAGRKRAESRHEFMEHFLATFYAEWRGGA